MEEGRQGRSTCIKFYISIGFGLVLIYIVFILAINYSDLRRDARERGNIFYAEEYKVCLYLFVIIFVIIYVFVFRWTYK